MGHRRDSAGFCRIACLIAACLIASPDAAARGHADEGAVARLTHALAEEEARDGSASPYLLPILEELAQTHRRDGALGEAAGLRRRALDIAVAAFGCDSASAAQAMAALAFVDIERRRHLDAEPLLIVAASVLADRALADHPAMAAIAAGLARIALARGDTKVAEARARNAVDIARRNPDGHSAEPLRTLGAVLTAEKRFTEAERLLAQAVTHDKKQHGADGAETARSLSQLGNLYLRQGRAKDALPLLEEAAAIDRTRLGATHPAIADDLHDLGLVYASLHRADKARAAFTSAIEILESGAGKETPRVAYAELELSRLYREEGNEAAAETASRDARRILNKAEAEEHRREREV